MMGSKSFPPVLVATQDGGKTLSSDAGAYQLPGILQDGGRVALQQSPVKSEYPISSSQVKVFLELR